jgi:hypothetical protein
MTAQAESAGDQTATMKSGCDADSGPNSSSISSCQINSADKIAAINPNARTKKAQAPDVGTSSRFRIFFKALRVWYQIRQYGTNYAGRRLRVESRHMPKMSGFRNRTFSGYPKNVLIRPEPEKKARTSGLKQRDERIYHCDVGVCPLTPNQPDSRYNKDWLNL